MRGMGCALYIRCALSIHQKECRKSFGCALYIGARYLPENTALFSFLWCLDLTLVHDLFLITFIGHTMLGKTPLDE
jgi:hypothetical protein